MNGILKYFFVPTRWTLIEIRTVAFLATSLREFVCKWCRKRCIAQKVVLIVRAYLAVDWRGASVPYCVGGIIIRIDVILRIIAVEVVFKGTGDAIRLQVWACEIELTLKANKVWVLKLSLASAELEVSAVVFLAFVQRSATGGDRWFETSTLFSPAFCWKGSLVSEE